MVSYFIVKHYDSNIILHVLSFDDFRDGNPKFESLKYNLSRTKVSVKTIVPIPALFEFRRVNTYQPQYLLKCAIRRYGKRKKKSLLPAFYEFAKLMFIKINEDRQLHERLEAEPLESLPLGLCRNSGSASLHIGRMVWQKALTIQLIVFSLFNWFRVEKSK